MTANQTVDAAVSLREIPLGPGDLGISAHVTISSL